MILLILSALFLGFIFQSIFFQFSYLSVALHEQCLLQTPPSEWPSFYKALICGQRLPSNAYLSAIKTLGLIHLFVVSGAHLQFLNAIAMACF